MCRIAGFWDFGFRGEYDIENVMLSMRDSMFAGGPDHGADFIDREENFAMGYRRLAIIDLSPAGNQPMTDGRLYIVFNGEIYNFMEIRKELEERGYSFKSRSDTEVILHSFREWGPECVNRFEGMWAFAIWDSHEKKLFLCRDRYGVKPLYHYFSDDLFMFASELRAFTKHPKFRKEIDEQAILVLLSLGCIVSPKSIFKHAEKLEPSHLLIIDKRKKVEKIRYYDVREIYDVGKKEAKQKRDENELAEELKETMKRAFSLRMVSDVPVGLFLSGGVDSSCVCAILSELGVKLKTFTIGSNEKEFDESGYAREVSKIFGTDHTEYIVDFPSAEEIIYKLADIYDEPFPDSSSIPTHIVSKLAREKVKVALSADGGDELFLGYPKYINAIKISKVASYLKILKITELLKGISSLAMINPDIVSNRVRRLIEKLRNIASAQTIEEKFLIANACFLPSELAKLYGTDEHSEFGLPALKYISDIFSNRIEDELINIEIFDFMTIFPDVILMKVDRASMNVSLEVREPFLDSRLVAMSLSIPTHLKLKNGETKYILKKLLSRYLPPHIIFRPKKGFSIPIHKWAETKNVIKSILSQHTKKDGIFRAEAIREILGKYENDKREFPRAWFIATTLIWAEKNSV